MAMRRPVKSKLHKRRHRGIAGAVYAQGGPLHNAAPKVKEPGRRGNVARSKRRRLRR